MTNPTDNRQQALLATTNVTRTLYHFTSKRAEICNLDNLHESSGAANNNPFYVFRLAMDLIS
jgi:hypothetical protein